MDDTRDGVLVYGRSIVCHYVRMHPNTQASGNSVIQAVEEAAQTERGRGVRGLKREVEKPAV
jgi:hypothetical protein